MNKLQSFIQSKPCGFLTEADMPELIALDRLCPVLVRCGGCRFTCAVQDVDHLVACISAGGDYVRDVSFPVGSLERAASWQEANARLIAAAPELLDACRCAREGLTCRIDKKKDGTSSSCQCWACVTARSIDDAIARATKPE